MDFSKIIKYLLVVPKGVSEKSRCGRSHKPFAREALTSSKANAALSSGETVTRMVVCFGSTREEKIFEKLAKGSFSGCLSSIFSLLFFFFSEKASFDNVSFYFPHSSDVLGEPELTHSCKRHNSTGTSCAGSS